MGKGGYSFSFIRRFRRKQTAVRVALFLLILLIINLFYKETIYNTVGSFLISGKVQISNFFERLSNETEYFIEICRGTAENKISELTEENVRLNWKIKQLENLRRENARLQKMLDLREQYHDEIVIAKVSTIFVSDFARAAIINVGRKKDIREDDIVINSEGLVGRIVEVHDNWSKMFLVTDENFNVPTKIGKNGANAVVSGCNSDVLKLRLVHEDIPIENGDVVLTSEYGSVFIEKIPVGVIVKDEKKLSIKPYVNFNSLKYVGVIIKHEK